MDRSFWMSWHWVSTWHSFHYREVNFGRRSDCTVEFLGGVISVSDWVGGLFLCTFKSVPTNIGITFGILILLKTSLFSLFIRRKHHSGVHKQGLQQNGHSSEKTLHPFLNLAIVQTLHKKNWLLPFLAWVTSTSHHLRWVSSHIQELHVSILSQRSTVRYK